MDVALMFLCFMLFNIVEKVLDGWVECHLICFQEECLGYSGQTSVQLKLIMYK